MNIPTTFPPLLSELFHKVPNQKIEGIRIKLGVLAKSLGVQVARLAPLVREGLLRRRDEGELVTSETIIDAVPEAALQWLRGFFLDARAKPLFSIDDLAELLKVQSREVLPLAAAHDIPAIRDPALGYVFSIWSARTLVQRVFRSGQPGVRFDRQALLWMLLGEDPSLVAEAPKFEPAWEREIARVAQLEEPARGLRFTELMEARRDAEKLVGSYRARILFAASSAATSSTALAAENSVESDLDSSS